MGSGINISTDLTEDGNMYEIRVEADGFIEVCFVSSMHLIDEKIMYLKAKINEEARKAFLQDFDDV
jgi:hypothetical protein|tara:strand:- start:1951 stop:2148 length:198 start_codon:yes stop_codon:yes gene_type:complete